MRLKHLEITNCSRVSDIDIEVRDNLVLIGPNGSGKTTVLLCLDMLFGMSNQRLYGVLSEGFIRDESQPLIVEAALGNLDDDELAAFPDEVGRCTFDKPRADLFFDVVERRYEKIRSYGNFH